MRVILEKVDSSDKEEALIKAVNETDDIKAAMEILEGGVKKLALLKDGKTVLLEISFIYYIESVDKRTFVYTK